MVKPKAKPKESNAKLEIQMGPDLLETRISVKQSQLLIKTLRTWMRENTSAGKLETMARQLCRLRLGALVAEEVARLDRVLQETIQCLSDPNQELGP